MNCYKGVCRYLDDNGKCNLDEKECDYHCVDNSDTCHSEKELNILLSCENVCKYYNFCTET